MSQDSSKLRLDKWLWAARFYKTRALATEAIQGGHVHLNQTRVKPSRNVQVGDTLSIRKGTYEFVVEVLALSSRRGPAGEAQKLYHENEDSRKKREALAEQHRLLAANQPRVQGKPDKRARRQIIRFTNKNRD